MSERMRAREASTVQALTALVAAHGTVEVHRVAQHFAVCVGEACPQWFDGGTIEEAIRDAALDTLPDNIAKHATKNDVRLTITTKGAA